MFYRRRLIKKYLTALQAFDEFGVIDATTRTHFVAGVSDGCPKWFKTVVDMTIHYERFPDGRERMWFVYPKMKDILRRVKETENEYKRTRRTS